MNLNELTGWQRNFVKLCVAYRIAEKGEEISIIPSIDDNAGCTQFVENVFYDMQLEGLLESKSGSEGTKVWALTDKGKTLIGNALSALDRMTPFEIFGAVDLNRVLTDDEILGTEGDDAFLVRDEIYDPRFAPYGQSYDTSIDLRLGMIMWLAENSEGKADALDPHQVVFIRNLANGDFDNDDRDFWLNLYMGQYFEEIAEIVSTAYTWDLLADNDEQASKAMQLLYTAGCLERMKRDSVECSNCGATLGSFIDNAKYEGYTLDTCPCCEASFLPPPSEYVCPHCNGDLEGHERRCPHCQSDINWSGEPGSVIVTETTETTTETVNEYDDYGYGYYDPWYGGYYDYGYTGWYGYYDPWDPYDALATAIILDAIF